MGGMKISRADQREVLCRWPRPDRYTRHGVTAPRAGVPSGRTSLLLTASVSVIRVRALGLRIRLGHIRSSLGLAVEVRTIAVVHVARRVDPHQPGTAASSLRPRSSLRRRRRLRPWCRRRRHSRCRRGSSLRRRRSHIKTRRRRVRIPRPYPLMPAAGALFVRRRPIRSILALPCRLARRSPLSYGKLRAQKPQCNRHKTNCHLHKSSKETRFMFGSNTAESYPIPLRLSFRSRAREAVTTLSLSPKRAIDCLVRGMVKTPHSTYRQLCR